MGAFGFLPYSSVNINSDLEYSQLRTHSSSNMRHASFYILTLSLWPSKSIGPFNCLLLLSFSTSPHSSLESFSTFFSNHLIFGLPARLIPPGLPSRTCFINLLLLFSSHYSLLIFISSIISKSL